MRAQGGAAEQLFPRGNNFAELELAQRASARRVERRGARCRIVCHSGANLDQRLSRRVTAMFLRPPPALEINADHPTAWKA